ncbi:MAG: hypothetical protein ABJA61_05290 [Caldimonas sp.]
MKNATLSALCTAVILAACGGSDFQAPPPATSEVPASASQSIDGFIAYLKRLVASAADMLEPVDTSAVTGPKDETSEPQKVD